MQVIDLIFFPLRAITMFTEGKFGLSSLRDERYAYVSKEVKTPCLDVGCGEGNLFIKKYLKGRGKGIDVFDYNGLLDKQCVLRDITKFPFKNNTFNSVVLIASINHIPKS